jgi:hypothetical protein
MSTIPFSCPHCLGAFEIDASMGGQSVDCPACGGALFVPSAAPLTPIILGPARVQDPPEPAPLADEEDEAEGDEELAQPVVEPAEAGPPGGGAPALLPSGLPHMPATETPVAGPAWGPEVQPPQAVPQGGWQYPAPSYRALSAGTWPAAGAPEVVPYSVVPVTVAAPPLLHVPANYGPAIGPGRPVEHAWPPPAAMPLPAAIQPPIPAAASFPSAPHSAVPSVVPRPKIRILTREEKEVRRFRRNAVLLIAGVVILLATLAWLL